ncbi:hypothetical protein MAM1_0051d03357 [Mucor ambiguus]|uniref:Uncharacterized protein n=1 Tax=Mucor ambiguus TaxID=91626 RepID=A0A0C9M439_9FUNG|nr:hypothetical protein MAM1_0051d03357 [Mucor ambiguus]
MYNESLKLPIIQTEGRKRDVQSAPIIMSPATASPLPDPIQPTIYYMEAVLPVELQSVTKLLHFSASATAITDSHQEKNMLPPPFSKSTISSMTTSSPLSSSLSSCSTLGDDDESIRKSCSILSPAAKNDSNKLMNGRQYIFSTALAAPTASSSFVAIKPSSSVQAAATAASVSADPRSEKWAHMKVALPDGLFPEDKVVLEQQLQIVPMIAMDDTSLPQPATAASRNRIDKHQRIDIQPAYKHMGIIDNTDEQEFYNVVEIAPLSPELQKELNQEHEASVSNVEQSTPGAAASRRHRKYLGLSDNGDTQIMDLPMPANAEDIDATLDDHEEAQESSLQARRVVGLDNHGRMRFVNVPLYNRGPH